MSNFLRGGQITFHSTRMFVQLIRTTTKWAFIAWIILATILVANKFESSHYSYTLAHLKARFYNALNIKKELLTVGKKKITVENVLSNNAISFYYRKTLQTLVKQATVAFLIIVLGYIGVLAYFFAKGVRLKQSDFVRGREVLDANSLKRRIKRENKKKSYKAYEMAGIPYPFLGETHHTMIPGSTGAGKTVLISDLVSQIMARGDKAIIYDVTGTFTERFYRPEKDIILNPFDARSHGWSLLQEAEHILEFDTIAAALIGQSKAVENPFWPEGARTIIAELCKKFFLSGDFSTKGMISQLVSISLKDLHELLKSTPANNLTSPQNSETTLGLLSTLITYVKSLQYVKETDNNFSIRKWVHDRETDSCIFLTSQSNLHSTLVPLISVMMNIAINSVMTLPKDQKTKTWFIFDELASLNNLPSLEQGLTVTRNFGGCFVIGIQTISQLYDKYGRNRAETLSANCNNKVILRSSDPETARWCSDVLGTQEIELFKEGMSYGAHEMKDGVNMAKNFTEKKIALPSEIMSLENMHGFLIMTNGMPAVKIKFPYKTWPVLNPAFVPVKEIDKAIEEGENEGDNY